MKKTIRRGSAPSASQEPKSVAELIAMQRQLLGISTYAFASGCRCSEATIRHVETGRYQPSLLTCIRIADFLKLPRDYVAKLGGYILDRAEDALNRAEENNILEQFKDQLEADPELWQGLIELLPALSKDSRDRALQYVKFLRTEERRGGRHG